MMHVKEFFLSDTKTKINNVLYQKLHVEKTHQNQNGCKDANRIC